MCVIRKYIITICSMSVFSFVLFMACRKTGASPAGLSSFTTEAAKEFYYGVFRKSAEYAAYNPRVHGVKSPGWKHGIYQRKGDMEIVEFPLIKVKAKWLIPFSDSVSRADQGRIAAASLNRIVFIRTRAGIVVREMEYIPDILYAARKHFDISSNTATQLDKDFSGRIIQRYWDGRELSRKLIADGKVKASGRIKMASRSEQAVASGVSTNSQQCTVFEICEWERECSYVWIGDMIEKVCEPWQQTGNCWIEEYCQGNSDPCEGMNEEQCNCAFYGNCNADPIPKERTCAELFSDIYSTGAVLNEKESVNDCGNTGTTRYKCYLWRIYTASGGLIPLYYKSSDKATQVRLPNKAWKFTKLEHIDIMKDGTEVGWKSSVTNVTATSTISSNYGVDNIGTMHLRFTVAYEFKCADGEMVNFYDTRTTQNAWHVDE